MLDAHISGPRIAEALRDEGHDVRAVDEERALDGWLDEELLVLATGENRILVSFNARDFHRIVTEWALAGRSHAGCAIVVSMDHSEFGLVIRRVHEELTARPRAEDWRDYTCFISRSRQVD